ncbi:MAG TPA: DUF1080 domain-containing protein [Anaerohalosphaeraceae bacterium]|jgi:hypothetical protein|nr:DUF1080 domain-containing protein [Anaerohalosphaeraceae bacterium]HRT49067.1 DUF1080 domain-containing protein [Anaerohalosphaeraceae bacterium]HRT85680.1 DUF1080 domain-containing protein [Anaerohalosphaeraceae bacterium]
MKKSAVAALFLLLTAASYAAMDSGLGMKPPEGAIVLFDGTDLSQWTADGNKPAQWNVADGVVEVALDKGSIQTRREFRDFRLHIEFNVPLTNATGQGRGNSGVYIQKRYEVQILDSYGLQSKDQDCGAIYKTKAPDKNVCKKPGEWQWYDIFFNAAKWQGDQKFRNARITVLHNGIMIHDDFEIPNKTGAGSPEGPSAGPILLQNHGNNVRFRNIWIVPLNETAAPNMLTDEEKADGWKLLFDGKTGTGWRSVRSEGFPERGWVIRDGMIIVNPGGSTPGGAGDIVTVDQYANFELKVDFRLSPGGNSGIKYFVMPELLKKGTVLGIEYQLLDPAVKTSPDTSLAAAYDLFAPMGVQARPAGQWNTARIVSKNGHVEHWLNGRLVLEFDRGSEAFQNAKADSKFKDVADFGTIKSGYILLQDHPKETAFRNIKIRPL